MFFKLLFWVWNFSSGVLFFWPGPDLYWIRINYLKVHIRTKDFGHQLFNSLRTIAATNFLSRPPTLATKSSLKLLSIISHQDIVNSSILILSLTVFVYSSCEFSLTDILRSVPLPYHLVAGVPIYSYPFPINYSWLVWSLALFH